MAADPFKTGNVYDQERQLELADELSASLDWFFKERTKEAFNEVFERNENYRRGRGGNK